MSGFVEFKVGLGVQGLVVGVWEVQGFEGC